MGPSMSVALLATMKPPVSFVAQQWNPRIFIVLQSRGTTLLQK
jgi:hypothetical protein